MAGQEGISLDQTVSETTDDHLRTHNIAETIARLPECSALQQLITKADAAYLLRRSGMHTLFAPSNAALAQFSGGAVEELLTAHMLSGGFESFDLEKAGEVKTVAGQALPVKLADGALKIGPATVTRLNIVCTNGFVHLIDRVLTGAAK